MADRHEYLELLGDLHRSKSEWSAAEKAYESCQEAGGDRRIVLSKLAALARAQGQVQTALNLYQAVLSIDSDFALAQIGIGEVLESIGQSGHAPGGTRAHRPSTRAPCSPRKKCASSSMQLFSVGISP